MSILPTTRPLDGDWPSSATLSDSTLPPTAQGWLSRLHDGIVMPLASALSHWIAARARQRAIADLERLDDAVLRDIGLTRREVRSGLLHLRELAAATTPTGDKEQ